MYIFRLIIFVNYLWFIPQATTRVILGQLSLPQLIEKLIHVLDVEECRDAPCIKKASLKVRKVCLTVQALVIFEELQVFAVKPF